MEVELQPARVGGFEDGAQFLDELAQGEVQPGQGEILELTSLLSVTFKPSMKR